MTEDEIAVMHAKHKEAKLKLFTEKRDEFRHILDKITGDGLYADRPTAREFEWWYDTWTHVGYYLLHENKKNGWEAIFESEIKYDTWLENHTATWMYKCGGSPQWKKDFYDVYSTEWCLGLVEQK